MKVLEIVARRTKRIIEKEIINLYFSVNISTIEYSKLYFGHLSHYERVSHVNYRN